MTTPMTTEEVEALKTALVEKGLSETQADAVTATVASGQGLVPALLASTEPGDLNERLTAAAAEWVAGLPDLEGKVSEGDARKLIAALVEADGIGGLLGSDEIRQLVVQWALQRQAVAAAAEWVKKIPELEIEEGDIETVVKALAGARTVGEAFGNEDARGLVIRRALAAVAKEQGIEVTEEQMTEAVSLIGAGTVFQDLRGVTRSTFRALRRFPVALRKLTEKPEKGASLLRKRLKRIATRLQSLPKKVRAALRGESSLGVAELVSALDEGLDAILAEDLPLDVVRDWVVEMLGYQSVRLAIILYAKAAGVQLASDDIAAIQSVLAEGRLDPALEQMRKRAAAAATAAAVDK